MTILLGIIFMGAAFSLNVSTDALALCLFLWLIAAAIELHK